MGRVACGGHNKNTAHNHIAQWVDKVVSPPTCPGNASSSGNPCCTGFTCDPTSGNTCQVIIN